MPQNSVRIYNQDFAKNLSVASFFLHKKSKPLKPMHPGTNEHFYSSNFLPLYLFSNTLYTPTKWHLTNGFLKASWNLKFYAVCSSLSPHYVTLFP